MEHEGLKGFLALLPIIHDGEALLGVVRVIAGVESSDFEYDAREGCSCWGFILMSKPFPDLKGKVKRKRKRTRLELGFFLGFCGCL